MHLSLAHGALQVSPPSKLAIAVALPLVAYVGLTAFWTFPEWGGLEPTQAFALAKHLVVVLLIAVSLLLYSRVGSWVALAWCAFVPFERYVALFQDVVAVASGADRSLAAIDIVRIVLLLASLLLSAALVSRIHRGSTAAADAQADA
jgi:hypothetical protein